jgi:RNAse (barnase) inhibitor barstar
MKIIRLDASAWRSQNDFYSALLPELGAPAWHGRNLDALEESLRDGDINAVEPPFRVVVTGAPSDMDEFLAKVAAVFNRVQSATQAEVAFEAI